MNFTLNIGIIFLALDVYAIYRAISRSHGVNSTLAWIFSILAFPGMGAMAYLLVANPGIKTTTRRKRLGIATIRKSISENVHDSNLKEQGSILHLSSVLTGLLPTGGNTVELLTENEYVFEKIEREVLAAKRFIWVEYYIISNDETGRRFLDLLAKKAREGVHVLLLYDAVGSLRIDEKRSAAIRNAGGKAEAFLPVNPLRRRWSVHLRNQRKMIVIDGILGFTGGMNMGNEYSGVMRKKTKTLHFRDTHLMLYGPSVSGLSQTFAEDWAFATGETLSFPTLLPSVLGGEAIVAIVPSGPDQENNASSFVYFSGIATASKRCYLTTPYLIPDEPTIRALISAASRGVDVRILVPARSDVAIISPAARSYYPKFVNAGIRIYEYTPRMLHAKSIVVDEKWGVVGSANTDIRSFKLNFELGALVVDTTFAKLLEDKFFKDLEQSKEIRSEDLNQKTFFARLFEGACRLLSPLL